jgi:hypothetical protein
MALRGESIGAARFTNDFCVDSLAGHAGTPASERPPDDDVDPPEDAAPLELVPDELPTELSYSSSMVPDEPPPDPPLLELLVDDASSVPGSPGDAALQCARASARPRPRTTAER